MKKILCFILMLTLLTIMATGLYAQTQFLSEKKMELSSKAFYNNKVMSQRYTRFGANVNPPLTIKNIPEGTTSLALIVDDPDAPAKTWVHWVMFNIPVTDEIKERGTPGVQGKNDFGNNKYDGPQPPSGTHRYVFTLYALNTTLDLPEGTTKEELLAAMRGAILQKAQLIGLYGRKESDK